MTNINNKKNKWMLLLSAAMPVYMFNIAGIIVIVMLGSFYIFKFLEIMAFVSFGISVTSITFFSRMKSKFGYAQSILFVSSMLILLAINIYFWIQANYIV